MAIIRIFSSSKKTKKRKPTAKQRELSASWDALLKKYPPKDIKRPEGSLKDTYKLGIPAGRETPNYPSLNSGYHDTYAKPNKTYTGDKLLGIGTLHKSNAVPVFSQEDAVDISKMRRG